MGLLVELWIAVAAGAVLFSAFGFLLARAYGRAEQALEVAGNERLKAELDGAEARHEVRVQEIAHLEYRVERAEQSAAELSDALTTAGAENVRLDQELAARMGLSERLSGLQAENARLLAQTRIARRSEDPSTADLREQLRRAETQREAQQAQLDQAREAAGATAELRRQLDELRRQTTEETQAHAIWQSRATALEAEAARAQVLERTHGALATEVERLRHEQREHANRALEFAQQGARLQTKIAENLDLRRQCEAMSNELERLRTTSEAPHSAPVATLRVRRSAAKPVSQRVPASGLRRGLESDDSLQVILDRQMGLLAPHDGSVTAVLSDDAGLVLAGTGSEEGQERLAVLTALARDWALRTQSLSEMEHLEWLEMVDTNGRGLRVRFFDWADQPLALGQLGANALSDEEEEHLVSSFPELRLARSA